MLLLTKAEKLASNIFSLCWVRFNRIAVYNTVITSSDVFPLETGPERSDELQFSIANLKDLKLTLSSF